MVSGLSTKLLRIAIAAVVCATYFGFATYADGCQDGDKHISRTINGIKIIIKPIAKGSNGIALCRALIVKRDGTTVAIGTDLWMKLNSVSGKDINGDGQPDAVLESYSGGVHCCWTYWIVSLGDSPGLIRKIYNQKGAGFVVHQPDGIVVIETLDGAFDYFDDLSHTTTPFPSVYLKLDGGELKRIDEQYWPR